VKETGMRVDHRVLLNGRLEEAIEF